MLQLDRKLRELGRSGAGYPVGSEFVFVHDNKIARK